MELTEEKSQEQAEVLTIISLQIQMLDVEYCREAANRMLNTANRQEAMAVINPSYPQSKNMLIRAQGKALFMLCAYIDALKEVDKLKANVTSELNVRDDINRLFL